jgi:hypothetical protein
MYGRFGDVPFTAHSRYTHVYIQQEPNGAWLRLKAPRLNQMYKVWRELIGQYSPAKRLDWIISSSAGLRALRTLSFGSHA